MATMTAVRQRESLTREQIGRMTEDFNSNPSHRLMQNAVTQFDANDIALDRSTITGATHKFSNVLDDWGPTHQGRSGRCWLFAGLNLFRADTMKLLNTNQFEFSQAYMMFWDKLERANFTLESIIHTAGRPVDDRTVSWILDRPLPDAGQWDMFINLVRKYGVVPKEAMPETESSGNTARMNFILDYQIRQAAMAMRDLYASEAGLDAMREAKQEALKAVHRVLAIHLGTPPSEFDWQWTDKERTHHHNGTMAPLEFAKNYVVTPMDDFVCLVHDPRESSPVGRTFTIDFLGNVAEGRSVTYLNVDIELMKEITQRQLESGKPVWMGCDSGKQGHREKGLWDATLFDYAGVYDADFSLDKAERLNYHQTQMTHAMLFTGVDIVDGKARRWRIENSFGDKVADKGFFQMNDSWFDEYMFEIAVPRDLLPDDLRKALDIEPIVLAPWDPMGALAR